MLEKQEPPVRITQVRARNYFAFGAPEGVSIELKPLTLIFGRNSSGKTALMRLIRLALRAIIPPAVHKADPVQDPGSGSRHIPLRLDDLTIASNFVDLVHGRLPKEVGLGLDIQTPAGPAGYDADLLPADSVGDRCWLVRFAGRGPSDELTYELDLEATRLGGRAVYSGPGQPQIEGLAPVGRLPELTSGARALDAIVSHLGPLRVRVPAVMTRGTYSKLEYDGIGAPDLIVADDDLAGRVDDWYATNLDGVRLQIRSLADAFELTTTTTEGTPINISQAGEGLHQVLPIVVQQQRHRLEPPNRAILDLVEQPELHLHDAVHAPLADLFICTAQLNRGTVVVETHSEGLLLRVRRRIAEGTFNPDDLAVYFVDRCPGGSLLRKISININGELSDWPAGVFLEGYEEILAIQRAIRTR